MALKAFLELLKPQEDKEQAFKVIVEKEMERARKPYDMNMKAAALVIQMALSGGDCIRCKQPWKKVEVDNPFTLFTYYTPMCHCYARCWYCNYVTYEEVEAGIELVDCPRCGAVLGDKGTMTVILPRRNKEKVPMHCPEIAGYHDKRRWDLTDGEGGEKA